MKKPVTNKRLDYICSLLKPIFINEKLWTEEDSVKSTTNKYPYLESITQPIEKCSYNIISSNDSVQDM